MRAQTYTSRSQRGPTRPNHPHHLRVLERSVDDCKNADSSACTCSAEGLQIGEQGGNAVQAFLPAQGLQLPSQLGSLLRTEISQGTLEGMGGTMQSSGIAGGGCLAQDSHHLRDLFDGRYHHRPQ